MITDPELKINSSELVELHTIIAALQRHCVRQGRDIVLPDADAQELGAIRTALHAVLERCQMNARIGQCLREHHAHLNAECTPMASARWQRFLAAQAAFVQRVDAAREEVDLLVRRQLKVLHRVLTAELGASPIPCPRCASMGPHVPGPGVGPHHASLVCGQCQRFLRWLPKPRLAVQEVG